MFGDRDDDIYGADLLPGSTAQLDEALRGERAIIEQIDEFLRIPVRAYRTGEDRSPSPFISDLRPVRRKVA